MANVFDSLQDGLFNTVNNTFGYEATWQPSATGSPLQTAKVLFNQPTARIELVESGFDPPMPMIEYKQGDFIGLFESVRAGNRETITLQGSSYRVREVTRHWDGKTYRAKLNVV